MMKTHLASSMKKLTFSVGFLLLATPAVQAAAPPAPPQVDAKAFILMDYNSGSILAEGNPIPGLIRPA
ncbi:D-alanyl-D-alanine carboxypeptidase dacC precursor [Serratia rubidaea]|uniref:D-alanyl-D-alanine carboxypeptidase dacC n=1 Tax=Serratia rubidaea TaxID=61652 RepID=A0A4U9HH08_SERRU|nr:D-alanyl-D-alanine carboxypeptidase dacC precursor [Serratia rubidaea]